MILIVPSLSASLFPLIVVACYVFDVWFLPMRSLEVLISWNLPDLRRNSTQVVLSSIIDLACFGLGTFLAITYASNFSAIIHFFMTDAIGKLQL